MAKKTTKSRGKTASKSAPAKKKSTTKKVAKKKVAKPAPKAAAKKPASPPTPRPARAKKPETLAADIRKLDAELLKLINKRASLAVKYYESTPNSNSSVFSAEIDQTLSLIHISSPRDRTRSRMPSSA